MQRMHLVSVVVNQVFLPFFKYSAPLPFFLPHLASGRGKEGHVTINKYLGRGEQLYYRWCRALLELLGIRRFIEIGQFPSSSWRCQEEGAGGRAAFLLTRWVVLLALLPGSLNAAYPRKCGRRQKVRPPDCWSPDHWTVRPLDQRAHRCPADPLTPPTDPHESGASRPSRTLRVVVTANLRDTATVKYAHHTETCHT